MRRYESYKDSGVEWLGEVPSHWELGRISTYFTERRTKVSDKDYPALSVTKLGVFPQWENVAKTNDGDNRKLAKKGDFVINSRSDRKGSSGIAKQDGSVSLINIVLQPKKINSVYSEYLFKSYSFIEEFYRVGHGIVADLWTTRFEDIKNSLIIFPPLSEQQKISQFLDDKTAKIDQAVDLAEKQIALLKEHKQILIQNAVTRGLNPDVPLKDSGVEWIGQVPEHWEVMRLKFMLSEKLKYGANESAELDDPEQPRYIRITDIDEQGNLKNDTFKSLEFEKAKDYLLKLNDILLARSGATAGKSYIYKENLKNFACYAGYLIRVRLEQKKFNAKFVNYYFQSVGYWDWIKSVNIQATIQNVSAEKYNDFLLSVPNLQEQVTIVDYLDQKTAKIDQAIALKTAHIEKLKEYKSVLINDVVTGKVWVSV